MATYLPAELAEILRLHRLWSLNEGGKGGIRANLSGANLSGAIGLPIAADAPARLLAVAEAALATPDALEMGSWHQCETTHCICGWAEHLGGPLANLIIKIYGNDVGGLMLLGVKAHAHFYSSNNKARAFLQSVIDNATATEVQ